MTPDAARKIDEAVAKLIDLGQEYEALAHDNSISVSELAEAARRIEREAAMLGLDARRLFIMKAENE